jgi:hypothetical protein
VFFRTSPYLASAAEADWLVHGLPDYYALCLLLLRGRFLLYASNGLAPSSRSIPRRYRSLDAPARCIRSNILIEARSQIHPEFANR